MICPKCNSNALVSDVRTPNDIKFTIHRKYKCKCGFTFKTCEKILFTTLPYQIRSQYLDGGHYS